MRIKKSANLKLEEQKKELEKAFVRIKKLDGLMPIYSSCKKIRDKEDDPKIQKNWIQFESYF